MANPLTDLRPSGHGVGVARAAPSSLAATPPDPVLDFDALYTDHIAFVWRNLRRLGVLALDDACQDVFLVVHRRMADLPATNVRSWLFGILRRVAADHRRTLRRRGAVPIDAVAEPPAPANPPDARLIVHRILDQLDDDKREVLVLAELEQMTAVEIAAAIDVPVNTVYSRLRAARQAFERLAGGEP
jgi:RNA polymerase sigma-70 factor (ECF subfamily)